MLARIVRRLFVQLRLNALAVSIPIVVIVAGLVGMSYPSLANQQSQPIALARTCDEEFIYLATGQDGSDQHVVDCDVSGYNPTVQFIANYRATMATHPRTFTKLGSTMGEKGLVVAYLVHDGYPESYYIIYLNQEGKFIYGQ